MKRFILLLALLVTSPAIAADLPSLNGDAEVTLKKGSRTYRFHEAVSVSGDDTVLETVDDFGNTLFRIVFDEKKKGKVVFETVSGSYEGNESRFKKVLALPLTREDFLASLTNPDPVLHEPGKVTVTTHDVRQKGKVRFPGIVTFRSKKAELVWKWKVVTFKKTHFIFN